MLVLKRLPPRPIVVKDAKPVAQVHRHPPAALDPLRDRVVASELADLELAVRHVQRRAEHPRILRIGKRELAQPRVLERRTIRGEFDPRKTEHDSGVNDLSDLVPRAGW